MGNKLVVSLLSVVLVSVIGLGWVINAFYVSVASPESHTDEVKNYKTLVLGMAKALDTPGVIIEKPLQIPTLPAGYTFAINELDGFASALPEQLVRLFFTGKPLVLQTEGGVVIHVYLPNKRRLLSVSRPLLGDVSVPFGVNVVLTLIFYLGVIGLVVVWVYPLIKRLLKLQKAAQQFGEGQLNVRIIPKKSSYIYSIETEFNRMANRIECLIDDNKLLSRAVSHDLRTPIARLRFGIDTLAESSCEQQRDHYVQRLNNDLDEMESLVDTFLQFARLEEQHVSLQMETIDVKSFILGRLEELDEPSLSLHPVQEGLCTRVKADPKYLSMQLNNVISNALKYKESRVEIYIESGAGGLCIIIDDDGVGIAEEDWVDALKPFWRLDPDGHGKAGHGLGLSIVARIASWLGGSVKVGTARELGGASLKLFYPKVTN